MKRTLSLICVAILLMCFILPFGTALAGTYTVSLNVNFDENLLFSTYDVDVFLDSAKVGTYAHGRDFSQSFQADEGNHTIWFYEHNDRSNSGSIQVNVSSDTSVSCRIHCRSYKVEVSNVEIDRAEAPVRSIPGADESEPVQDETPAEPEETVPETEEQPAVSEPSVTSGNGVWLDFTTASDEDLEEALSKIKAEQRSRLKTKIVLGSKKLSLAKGKTEKLDVSVQDLPEGVTAGKITADTSDKTVAMYQGNMIRAVGNGSAVITFFCTLSDGTELSEECSVDVITPIKALQPKQKNVEMGVGDVYEPELTINPKDASITDFAYSTSDSSVAKVDSRGKVHAVGIGTATITVSARDGSGVSASFTVKATKKDDVGKTRITKDGVSVTLVSAKETKGQKYFEADGGKIYVLAEFLIENNSRKDVSISSMLSFDAYCDGYAADYSFGAAVSASQTLDGDVAAGKKMRGQIGYEVSKNWKEIEIRVKPDYWGGEELTFVIYKK